MKYNESLKPFYDLFFKLEFGYNLKFTPSIPNELSELNVKFTTTCNELTIKEFEVETQHISNTLINKLSKSLKIKGNDFKKELIEIIISINQLTIDYFNGHKYIGIIKDIPKTDLFEIDAYKMGALDYGKFEETVTDKTEFYKIIIDTLSSTKNNIIELIIETPKKANTITPLKFNVRATVLAELMNKLEEARWIDIPPHRGEISYGKLRDICSTIFEFDGSERTLYNALKDKKKLSESLRNTIIIPDIDDMK